VLLLIVRVPELKIPPSNHRVAKDASGVEILFGEAAPRDSIAREPLEMLKGFQDAFTA
jgi:hypothetical protein